MQKNKQSIVTEIKGEIKDSINLYVKSALGKLQYYKREIMKDI